MYVGLNLRSAIWFYHVSFSIGYTMNFIFEMVNGKAISPTVTSQSWRIFHHDSMREILYTNLLRPFISLDIPIRDSARETLTKIDTVWKFYGMHVGSFVLRLAGFVSIKNWMLSLSVSTAFKDDRRITKILPKRLRDYWHSVNVASYEKLLKFHQLLLVEVRGNAKDVITLLHNCSIIGNRISSFLVIFHVFHLLLPIAETYLGQIVSNIP